MYILHNEERRRLPGNEDLHIIFTILDKITAFSNLVGFANGETSSWASGKLHLVRFQETDLMENIMQNVLVQTGP